MLVTTNDSRIRLLSMDTFEMIRKYKGHCNREKQLRASMTSDREYLVCGSDDGTVYVFELYQVELAFIIKIT